MTTPNSGNHGKPQITISITITNTKIKRSKSRSKCTKGQQSPSISTITTFLLNFLPLFLCELFESRFHSILTTKKQPGHDFWVGLEPGSFELLLGVYSQYVSPQDAPRIGPREELGSPEDVPVETQCLAPSACESATI